VALNGPIFSPFSTLAGITARPFWSPNFWRVKVYAMCSTVASCSSRKTIELGVPIQFVVITLACCSFSISLAVNQHVFNPTPGWAD
jgi:hypothetical protein